MGLKKQTDLALKIAADKNCHFYNVVYYLFCQVCSKINVPSHKPG